jgi:MSHA biogenesis protein MshJ
MIQAPKARLLLERFDGLRLRDRLGLAGAVAVVIFFLVTVSLIAPDSARRKQAAARVSAQQAELGTVMMRFDELTKQLADDPVAQQQVLRDELLRQIAIADASLAEVDKAAPKMGSLVRELLSASPGVTVLAVKTLPVVTVIQPTAAKPPPRPGKASATDSSSTERGAASVAEAPAAVFRHGVEVSLKGNYLAMLPHLERLERSGSRLSWSEARLDVTTYPEARLTLVLYTLSGQQSPSLA